MSKPALIHLLADEIALYDRQIRLWGMQAQEKIRSANILLITVKALGNEIAKNLVLAGIASLTIVDNNLVTDDDLGAQFFITESDVGKPVSCRLRLMLYLTPNHLTLSAGCGCIAIHSKAQSSRQC